MKRHRTTLDGVRLLHEGALALAEVERAGVRVDRGYLIKTMDKIEKQVMNIEKEMKSDKIYKLLQKEFGDKAKIDNRTQLAHVIFRVMEYEVKYITGHGRLSTNKKAIEHVDLPYVKNFLKADELKHAKSHNLDSIMREMVETDEGWFVHPLFNLNTVRTIRSSSQMPNWQNNPVRNPEVAEMVRQAYIPRKGNFIVDPDMSQIEVRLAAVYTKDPNLVHYVSDEKSDMHGDMAQQIYILKKHEVTDPARHAAKNQFVFPEFFGSGYFQCAPELWDSIKRRNLTVGEDGMPLRKHLRRHDITELGDCDPKATPGRHTFAGHLKAIEQDFWGRRFKTYTDWKKSWYAAYQRDAGFSLLTGFAINGVLSRNDVINYPIQGTAFHCCLQALIWLVRWVKKYKLKSHVIGEIHDSIQGDVRPSERNDFIDQAVYFMTEKLRKKWDWINVPLRVKVSVSPRNESWFAGKKWTRQSDGVWALAT